MAPTQASPAPTSDFAWNVPALACTSKSVEPDVIPDFEDLQIFDSIGKYVAYLKSIKRPRTSNSELLNGVERVSQTITGCIELAESALQHFKTHQTQRSRTHDVIGWETSSLGSIRLVLRSLIVSRWQKTLSKSETAKSLDLFIEANPRLDRLGKPISGTDRASSSNLSCSKTP